ncbi:TDT family transporter [Rhodococcus sp. BP-316]|uniref:TDT family transporter n=1 Tax=Rhodococcus sp. BP-316 TaxID=2739445 RepID=UPI001C9A42EA|nr:TDT family transporter [Rhodococcus sp. BP-316]MBY6682085.1 TDT family transporter [Rhodococcus sp. BP-316]
MTTFRTATSHGLLRDLDSSGSVIEHITPNWFASVMGTGIVATAAATLPVQNVVLHMAAVVMWLLASTVLVVVSTLFAAHWLAHRRVAQAHAAHPVMMQFYGAPPMALLTVGAGTSLLGVDIIGQSLATSIFVVLWTVGTALGLATSVVVPYVMITRGRSADTVALPAWLMPVVPPMVSASTGALLLPHIADGQWRLAMLVGCYALFGSALVTGLMVTTAVLGRLLHGSVLPVQAAPTIWITLGVIGQSVTAANLLGADAAMVFTGDRSEVAVVLRAAGILFGMVMGGFGAMMFALATALTVHAARRGLRFSLAWWSFTFPVGTCVTGAAALGRALESSVVEALAVVLFAVLVTAWTTVATRTVREAYRGRVFLPA